MILVVVEAFFPYAAGKVAVVVTFLVVVTVFVVGFGVVDVDLIEVEPELDFVVEVDVIDDGLVVALVALLLLTLVVEEEEVLEVLPEEMLVGISTLGGLTVTLTLLVGAFGSWSSLMLCHFPL